MEVPVFQYAAHHSSDENGTVRQFTVAIDDEVLSKSLESAAAKHGFSVQEIVKEAVKQWLLDMKLDEMEIEVACHLVAEGVT